MSHYVALLRGINVGGNNLIKMSELKACFEKQGFRDVATYIQSGNVLFKSGESASAKLTRRIEDALVATFNCRASVVLRSQSRCRTSSSAHRKASARIRSGIATTSSS